MTLAKYHDEKRDDDSNQVNHIDLSVQNIDDEVCAAAFEVIYMASSRLSISSSARASLVVGHLKSRIKRTLLSRRQIKINK